VIDQERFDGLARGLATNRLSRGQVLKSFAAGLLLSSIGILSPRHTRVAAAQPTVPAWCTRVQQPAPPTPVPPTYPKRKANVVTGGCKAFRNRVKRGAIGLDGTPVKGAAGLTECIFTHTTPTVKTTKPKPGTSIVCLSTTSVGPVTFTGQPEIFLLDWQRKGASSKECEAYESKIESEIKKHEKVHANDCDAIAAEASAAWNNKKHEFADCGKTPKEARRNIKAKIEASLDAFQVEQMNPCWDHIGDKFDAFEKVPICCMGPGGCGCPKGKECCGSDECVDLKTDPLNCGECNFICPENYMCVDGECVCPPGSARSGASGSALGAGLAAEATLCCPEGQTECGGACVDACVSPEVLDPNTCECVCPSGGTQCCPPGKTFCPNVGCVDLSSGVWNPESGYDDHCGACGVSCRRGSGAFCAQGKCQCGPGTPCSYEGCPPDKPNCHPNEKVYCCDPPGSGYPKAPTCCHSSQGHPYCCGSDETCGTSGVPGDCDAL
jgi:hypothetical protein